MSEHRRVSSAGARARGQWSLAALKLFGELALDEPLTFIYESVTFTARVSIEGFLACDELPNATRATLIRHGRHHYEHPSNFTLDCLDEYWRRKGIVNETHTNPSGWDRVKRVRDDLSLNVLRDQLVRANYRPPFEVARHRANDDDADESSSASSEAPTNDEPPLDVTTRLLCGESIYVETLQRRFHGYKPVAEHLEQVASQLLYALDSYEQLVERLVRGNDARSLELAQRVVAERARRAQLGVVAKPTPTEQSTTTTPPPPLSVIALARLLR